MRGLPLLLSVTGLTARFRSLLRQYPNGFVCAIQVQRGVVPGLSRRWNVGFGQLERGLLTWVRVFGRRAPIQLALVNSVVGQPRGDRVFAIAGTSNDRVRIAIWTAARDRDRLLTGLPDCKVEPDVNHNT